jgi:subtilisin family serine protease
MRAAAIAADRHGRRAAVADEELEGAVLAPRGTSCAAGAASTQRLGGGVLDTGMDLGHPTSRAAWPPPRQSVTRAGPAQSRHPASASCGRKPAGSTPRYGIAHQARIFVGKVLPELGGGTSSSVLAGMNWAVANRCQVIDVARRRPRAGRHRGRERSALAAASSRRRRNAARRRAGELAVDHVGIARSTLTPSCSRTSQGRWAPGRDVFSSVPRPPRYGIKSGTSMATPHVAGVAALWAQTSASLRGVLLWRKLQATARPLPFPIARVGRGLVQAP